MRHATIFIDSMSTISIASGRFHPNDTSDLSLLVAMLFRHLAQTAHISLQHVKAHVGHPWNELADSLCTLSSKQQLHSILPHRLAHHAKPHSALDWIWLQQHQDACAYPSLQHTYLEYSMPRTQYAHVDTHEHSSSAQIDLARQVTFSVMQHNVCSLLITDTTRTCDSTQLALFRKQIIVHWELCCAPFLLAQ